MKKILNKKVIYIIAMIIIIAGIVATCVWKTNFSLLYGEHTRINLYLGKSYDLADIKQIINEVFGNKEASYQKIETFNDSIAVNVKQVSQEQLTVLKDKIKEKYEIEEIDNSVKTSLISHYQLRDMIKPYAIPMAITTLVILAYVGIRYLNVGIFKVIFTLLLRLIVSEAVLVSIIEIARIPVNVFIVPMALVVYILVIILTTREYENILKLKKQQENKKK